MADWVIYKDGSYWSDAHGWRSFDRATHFTPAEKTSIPIGKWVDIDEIQAWMGDKAKEDIPETDLDQIRGSDRLHTLLYGEYSLSVVCQSIWLGREAMIKFMVHAENYENMYDGRSELINRVPKWLFLLAKKAYLG